MNLSTHTTLAEGRARAHRCAAVEAHMQKSPFCFSDIWKAPLHDFPIRDEILYQYLPLSPEMDVLEIGPGSGYTAFRLARYVRRITLIDVAAANIERLRETLGSLANVKLLHADVCARGLAESLDWQLDAIFGLEVFELLPDPGECLKNLAGLLRRSGVLLLQFPNYPPPKSPGITYFKSREELDEMLRAAGFLSWEIYALRLRPLAQTFFRYLHEQPIRIVRFLRSQIHQRPVVAYDETWAFRQRKKLEAPKYAVHAAWALLSLAMRPGGECFERITLGRDILNHNLLVVARR